MLTEFEAMLGRRLKFRRQALGLTQKQLADRVEVTPQLIHKWETAQSSMYAARLYAVALALGVTPDYFFDVMDSGSGRAKADPPPAPRS